MTLKGEQLKEAQALGQLGGTADDDVTSSNAVEGTGLIQILQKEKELLEIKRMAKKLEPQVHCDAKDVEILKSLNISRAEAEYLLRENDGNLEKAMDDLIRKFPSFVTCDVQLER